MKKLLLSAITLITSYLGIAQTGNFVANYTYQINSGTYTALTSPTVLSSGSAMDDAVFTVTLSSPFNFNGANTSTLVVTENGYISVGTDPNSYYPLSNTTTGNLGVIAPFGRDLGGIDAASQLSWAEVGNEAVFQWKNMKRYLSSTGEILNFQARLNKTNGVITFVYGPTTLASGSSSTYPQVGIRGAATTWAANVNNLTLSNTTGNCNWLNATAGSTNSSTMYFDNTNSAIAPVSGLEYVWTPSTLTPPVRTIAAVSGVGSNSVVLNFTQPAGTPTGYNVQYRPVNSCSWTNASGNPYAAASTISLTGLSSTTQYEYRIQAIFGAGNSIYSHVPSSFTTLSPVCSGAPNAGTATATSASVCSATNFTLNVSGATTGVSGLTYQWQSSPNGTTWTNISATTSSAVVSQTTTTYYQLVVTCSGSAQSATSTPVMVGMNTLLDCYCNTTPGTVNTVDIITGVTLANSIGTVFTQTSSAVSPNFVTYYNTPVDLVQGSTTNVVSITYGSDGTQYGAVWIDFNRNGVYEASENVGLATSSAAGNATVNYTFTVPAGATLGNTRMRVRGGSDAAYTAGGACTASSYGETEDYLVNIITPPTCLMPTALTATNVSASGVNLSWTAPASGTPVSYIYEIRTSGNAGSGATGLVTTGTVTAPSTSVSVSGLTASTPYTVYVVTNCGAGDFSAWTTAKTFTTIASCPVPTGLTVSAVTATSAVSTWTAGASENAWDVYYGPAPLTVPGATTVPTTTTSATTYSLTGLTPSTAYAIYVRANCGSGNASVWTPVSTFTTPCLPPNIVTTAGGIRCGNGTTTLTATADMGGTINWYTNSTGGAAIATGTLYTTPTITTNTTYYVSAIGSLVAENVGRASASSSSGYLTTPDWGIQFTTTKNVLINSATIYPVGSGNVTIALVNASGTELASTASIPVTGTGTNSPVVVNLGFNVPAGTGYRLVLKAYSGLSDLIRDGSGNTFPYTSASGAISVTAGWNGSPTTSSYYWFYNLNVSSGCESARTAVTATVTTPPVLTVNSPSGVCAGSGIATLNVTSNLSDYDTYTWSPSAGLYTDAGATTPYAGGNATTIYVKTNNAGINNYSLSANSSVSGCATSITASVSILDAPYSLSVTTTPGVVCAGRTVTLSAVTNTVPTILLNENFNGVTNSWTTTNASTGGTPSAAAWTLRNSPYTSNVGTNITSNDASQFIMTDSDAQGSGGTTTTTLKSPAFSTMGMASLNLTFYHFYNYYTNDVSAKVEISTNGTTWTSLTDYATGAADIGSAGSFSLATFNLNSYVNNPTVYIRFNYNSAYGYGWAIDNVKVSGTSASTYNYSWTSTPAGFTSSVANPTISPSANANYSVVVTNNTTSCSNSASLNVVVNPVPTISASASQTILCNDGSTGSSTITAVSSASSYSWSTGATTSTIVVTPAVTAVYTVTATDGTCDNSTTVTITVNNCTGIKETVANGISVYPNPTNGVVNFAINAELNGKTSVEIYDAIGKLVIKENLTKEITTINTANLENGVYFFKIKNNNQEIKVGKMIKQ